MKDYFPVHLFFCLIWPISLLIPDVSGVVQSVSPTMSIRRKSNNEIVPKRDITIADKSWVYILFFALVTLV